MKNDDTANSILIEHVKNGDLKAVIEMLRNGFSPNAQCGHALKAVTIAASKGHYGIMKALLDAGADANSPNLFGVTALMESISCGKLKCARTLIKYGADVNARDCDGWTALIHAAIDNNTKCMELLIAHGANTELADKRTNKTALLFAAEYNGLDAALCLAKHGADLSPLDGTDNGEKLKIMLEKTLLKSSRRKTRNISTHNIGL